MAVGGTLVHVRHPHVEGHHTQLESQAGDDEHHTEHQHLLVGRTGQRGLVDLADVQRAGGAVHHRQAIEQEARGQRTQHEVLHGGFGRLGVVAAQGHKRIQRQRHQLQAQVDGQEVVADDHDRDAQQREHAQREQFTLQHLAGGRIRLRVNQRAHHGQRGTQRQQVTHGIGHHHLLHGIDGGTRVQRLQVQAGHAGQRQHRQVVGRLALRAGDEQVHERDQAGHGQQDDLGGHRDPVEVSHVGSGLSSACFEPRA